MLLVLTKFSVFAKIGVSVTDFPGERRGGWRGGGGRRGPAARSLERETRLVVTVPRPDATHNTPFAHT